MKKCLMILLALLTVLSCLPVTALAHAVPEEGKKGSITVTMLSGEKAVPGGELTLYRVGKVQEDDGNFRFVPTETYAGKVENFGDLNNAEQSEKVAKSLAEYVQEKKLTGVKKTIGTDGKAKFSDLEQGLYLLVQTKAASGYSVVKPFLVSVPYLKNGKYVYDVDANSKTELKKTPETTTTPPTTKPSQQGNKLPQTGQLWWPVPVLLAVGLLFVILGLLRRRGNADGK